MDLKSRAVFDQLNNEWNSGENESIEQLRQEALLREARLKRETEEEERRQQEEYQRLNQEEDEKEIQAQDEKQNKLEIRLNKYASSGSKYMHLIRNLLMEGVNPNALCENSFSSSANQQQQAEPEGDGAMDLVGGGLNIENVITQGQIVSERWNPLHWAAHVGDEDLINLLLDFKSDPNAKTEPRQVSLTPLHMASSKGHVGAVELLIKRGASVDIRSGNKDRRAFPLHLAARSGFADVVDVLLDFGADIDGKLSSGRTSVLVAAATGRHEVVERLIQRGCDVLAAGEGKTSLWALSRCSKGSKAQKMITAFKAAFSKKGVAVDLSDCGLTTIPNCFQSCQQLNVMDLSNNEITSVPPVLFEMPFVQQVDVSGNKLPAEVVRALKDNPQPFLGDMKKGRAMTCGEIKLMVLGCPGIGKSTLVSWLKKEHHPTVSMDTSSTDGVTVNSITLIKSQTAGTFRTWDFDANSNYYKTHPFFLSEQGIYMVCWDIRKSPEEGDVEFFLQSINSRTTSASVLLVGLHLDALDSDVESEQMWLPPGSKGGRENNYQIINDYITEKFEKRYANIEGFAFVDGEDGRGIEQLIPKLLKIAKGRQLSMPHTFLELMDLIATQAKRAVERNDSPIVHIKELRHLAREHTTFFDRPVTQAEKQLSNQLHDDDLETEQEVENLELRRLESGLLFMHNLGRIIFFGLDQNLGKRNGMVVLHPQWLVQFLKFMTIPEICNTYVKKGKILHSDLVNFVWEKYLPNYIQNRQELQDFVLEVLESYDLVVKMPHQMGVDLIPSLLPPESPQEKLFMFPPLYRPLDETYLSSLNLLSRIYVFKFLPTGLITRLIIQLMEFYKRTNCIHWRYGVCLHLDTFAGQIQHTYVLAYLDRKKQRVVVRVRSAAASIASAILLSVTGLLQNLIQEWYHLSPADYDIVVPCIACSSSPVEASGSSTNVSGGSSVRSSTHLMGQQRPYRGSSLLDQESNPRHSMVWNIEKKEKLMMRIKIEEQMKDYGRANVSLVVAVEQKDTVKGIYDKVFQKLLRDIPEKDKKKVSELISGNALYFVDHNGAIEEVIEGSDLIDLTNLSTYGCGSFYFTPGPPLLSGGKYSDVEVATFPLPYCEAKFMKGEQKVMCRSCGKKTSLFELVPDVLMTDVEQYGCSVATKGQLELTKKVGKGAFGDVFLGLYKSKPVAIKQILLGTNKAAEILKEFQKELRLGAMFNHPNIVKVEAFTMHPFQLVMEFIPCGDLYSFLNDPDGVQKYLSRIDDSLEKDVLPVKRSFEAYKPPENHPKVLELPLEAVSHILRFVMMGWKKELAKGKGTKMMSLREVVGNFASTCWLFAWGAKIVAGEVEIEQNFHKLEESMNALAVEARSKNMVDKKNVTTKELKEKFQQSVAGRIACKEHKVTYQEAKLVHQNYLDAMEAIQSWHTHCLKASALSTEMIFRLSLEFTAGISYLHSQDPPIIHRDLKTPNVLLMARNPDHHGPIAKVADFGASAQMFMSSLQSGLIGTEDKAKKHVVTLTTWLAPEILVGQPYSQPSDVYAIGIMMWELLTRRHPFDHLGSMMNEVKVRQKVPSDDPDNRPPVPKDGPKEFCQLMVECWDGNPAARPTAAQALGRLFKMAEKYDSLKEVVKGSGVLDLLSFEEMPTPEPTNTSKTSQNQDKKKEPSKRVDYVPTGQGVGYLEWGQAKGKVGGKNAQPTALALADMEGQVWVGMSDGSFCVFDASSKSLLVQRMAHAGPVRCFYYGRGRMWSAGGDTVHVWSCNDIGEAPKAKEGEVLVHHKAKLREVWKKQYFVLNPETRILSFYDGSSKKKRLGDIELVSVDSGKSLVDTSSAPTHHASLAGGMSSSSSSSNGMMRSASSSAKGIQRKGEGVRIENVVTHKRQFKIHSGSKTYFLKTTADTNDQNGKNNWMGAILATIPRVVVPIKSIRLDSEILSLVRFANKNESDSVLFQRKEDIHVVNEQSFTQSAPFRFERTGAPLACICAMHPFILGARDNEISFYNTMTQQQTPGATFVATSEITCLNSTHALTLIVTAGTKNGEINVWRGASVRGGGKEKPQLVLNPPIPCLRMITILNNRLLWCVGTGLSVAEYSLDFDFFGLMEAGGGDNKKEREANEIKTNLKGNNFPLDLSFSLAAKKAYMLAENGDTVYFNLK